MSMTSSAAMMFRVCVEALLAKQNTRQEYINKELGAEFPFNAFLRVHRTGGGGLVGAEVVSCCNSLAQLLRLWWVRGEESCSK